MGLLIDGRWSDQWYDTTESGGAFVRSESQFRHWITTDGSAGPSGEGGFKAEAGRYHLYLSLACPWAHRTLIFRRLKDLDDLIGVTVVDPHMLENGWELNGERGSDRDTVNGHLYLYELYLQACPDYSGRVTVPVLWDKANRTIVSNESSEIIRMFNSAFDALTDNHDDLYPKDRRAEIDRVNRLVYHDINNGVYRCGFSTSQSAYEDAYDRLFKALDDVEGRLGRHRYLVGECITEADWRLFTTLVRFDAVYYSHFKCNRQRILDYPNLSNYVCELYQVSGIRQTVNMDHIKQHYYYSHPSINPTRIVPKGPRQDFGAPHNRDTLFS